jgi:hypothetical protein
MPEKKKRGRRPKNNIIVNENPNFDTDKKIDNLIVCLKNKKEETICEPVDGFSFNNYEVNEINEINEINENNLLNNGEGNTCVKTCWNCCHTYDFITCQAISKYENDIFYTYGNFCSYECTARYLFETYHNNDLWNKYSLLNLYYNITTKKINEIVKLAPNRLALQLFGGNLTIEEYRANHSSTYQDVRLPPIIPVNLNYYNYDNKVKINELNVLKLYRTKPIANKNNILNTMNIDTI